MILGDKNVCEEYVEGLREKRAATSRSLGNRG